MSIRGHKGLLPYLIGQSESMTQVDKKYPGPCTPSHNYETRKRGRMDLGSRTTMNSSD